MPTPTEPKSTARPTLASVKRSREGGYTPETPGSLPLYFRLRRLQDYGSKDR